MDEEPKKTNPIPGDPNGSETAEESDVKEIAVLAKWLPDEPEEDQIFSGKNQFTEEDQKEYARKVVSLFRLTAARSRDRITKAIQDAANRKTLTLGERMLCDQVVTVYFLNPETRQEITGILGIEQEKIGECIRQTLLEMGVDVQYLTQLDPPKDTQQAKTSAPAEEQDEQLELFPPEQIQQGQGIDPDKILPKLLTAQRDGYNRLRGITHKNSQKDYIHDANGLGVKMERVSRKGDRASVTLNIEQNELSNIIDAARKEYIDDVLKGWNVAVKMLMDYAVMKLTQQNNYVGKPKGGKIDLAQFQNANKIVIIPIEEWCQVRGIPLTKASIDKERQELIANGKTLFRASLEWEETTKKGVRTGFKGVHPFPYVEIKNNEIKIEISTQLTAVLLTSPVMPYREEFLRISNRTPNAYLIATKLAELCNINGHRKAKPSYIVSVAALLDATDYPTKEKVLKDHAGRYAEYIINPFTRAMREIEGVSSLTWRFCMAGGKPLANGVQPEKKIDDFLTAYISYSFTDEQSFENLQETT